MQSTQDPLTLARFWSKVDVRHPAKCWHWRASVNPEGYGMFWDGVRLVRAHRFAFQAAGGDLDGAVADHECHNASSCTDVPCAHRRCCNPSHLRAVTQAVNSKRGRTGDHHALKTHCRNGHEYTPENTIYPLRPGGRRDERVCKSCTRASQAKYNTKRKAQSGK